MRYEGGLEHSLLHIHFYSILDKKNGVRMKIPLTTPLIPKITIWKLPQKGSEYILLGKCQNLISLPPIKMWKVDIDIIADLMHRYSLSANNAKGK